jgi:hypothetical protein
MAIYDFNLSTFIEQLTPKFYSFDANLWWQKSLLKPIDWLKLNFFDYYAKGLSRSTWNIATPYIVGNIVRFDEGLYECLISNTGQSLNSEYWLKIQDDRIGLYDRMNFKSNKKVFEYALNTRFYTSGIYITNVTASNPFYVGIADSSTIGTSNSSLDVPLTNTYNLNNFTINVPTAIYSGLGTIEVAERKIRTQADKINMAGMVYNIVTY